MENNKIGDNTFGMMSIPEEVGGQKNLQWRRKYKDGGNQGKEG